MDIRKEFNAPASRELISHVTIPKDKMKPRHFSALENAKKSIIIALLDRETHKDQPAYIRYLEWYRDEIVALLDILYESWNNKDENDSMTDWNEIDVSGQNFETDSLEEDLDDTEEDNDFGIPAPLINQANLKEYENIAINNGYLNSTMYEDLLWMLIERETEEQSMNMIEKDGIQCSTTWICIENACSIYPDYPVFYALAARFQLQSMDNVKKAIYYYNRAIDIDPTSIDAHDIYVDILSVQEKYYELDEYIQLNYSLKKEDYEVENLDELVRLYYKLTFSAIEQKRHEDIINSYLKDIFDIVDEYMLNMWYLDIKEGEQNEDMKDIMSYVTGLCLHKDYKKTAIWLLESRFKTTNASYYILPLADCYFALKQYKKSLYYYDQVNDSESRWYCYVKLKQWNEAHLAYSDTILDDTEDTEPDHDVYESYRQVLENIDTLAPHELVIERINLCEKAIRFWPDNFMWFARIINLYDTHNITSTYECDTTWWADIAEKFLQYSTHNAFVACINALEMWHTDKIWCQKILLTCIARKQEDRERNLVTSYWKEYHKHFSSEKQTEYEYKKAIKKSPHEFNNKKLKTWLQWLNIIRKKKS